ncbi:MAG: YgiQ family radical SAM protein [Anaerolineae bacterium]|jgi:uncharacterized radical SAM protein YgiQ|nr:YgiQ family radical SAM protein [Anaerolineae bacterium]
MFLPTTLQEMRSLGWNSLDIIIVSGDSYIDSPFMGTAVIGKVLANAGYRVGIISQPQTDTLVDIGRLGEPELFWGVTAGSIDSMVSNYTALKKKRRNDDYTPGGENNRRPDRATIVYTGLIRRFSKQASPNQVTPPIVLGGIEASLRRVPHYDYWTNKIRRSILFDSKADYLLYGMAEKSTLEFATALHDGNDPHEIRGLSYIAKEKREDYLEMPAYEVIAKDKMAFIEMFHTFYKNNDPIPAKGITQKHGDRYLVQNPPAFYQTGEELDAIYALDYERAQHPYYAKDGKVRALDTIGFSIPSHRGCYGECNFCAIAVHEGRTIRSRSQNSIVSEAKVITRHPKFKGYISDLGGPTANMYGYECGKKLKYGNCPTKRCVSPGICPVIKIDHRPHVKVLKKVHALEGVKKVFVASGLRYDMILSDTEHGDDYLRQVVTHHTSGQMKIAPEHTEDHVLHKMGKPGTESLVKFKERFEQLNKKAGKKQFLTYYMIAAHPGCDDNDMRKMKNFVSSELQISPEQVQIFTPTPSTYSSVMYWTEMDPWTLEPMFIEKDPNKKRKQKDIITQKPRRNRKRYA